MPELNPQGGNAEAAKPVGGGQGEGGGGSGGVPPEVKSGEPPKSPPAADDPRDKAIAELKTENERSKRYVVTLVQRFKEAMEERGSGGEDLEEAQERELKKFKERFEENPRQALDEHFNQRLAPILERQQQGAVVQNRERGLEKLVSTYGQEKVQKYMPEVEKFLEGMSAETLAAPSAWEDAFRFIRSNHFDEEVAEAVKKHIGENEPNEDNMFVEGANRTAPARGNKPRFSGLEKKIMQDMGMKEDEWVKYGGGNGSSTFSGEED